MKTFIIKKVTTTSKGPLEIIDFTGSQIKQISTIRFLISNTSVLIIFREFLPNSIYNLINMNLFKHNKKNRLVKLVKML